jgi:hypothetical protein
MGLEVFGYEMESKSFELNRMDISYEGNQCLTYKVRY